ncbi:MAG: aromatic-ring-hydroxylating dioxygenase [Acidimicrobiales bacterium]|nr:aromatic-ring-hydroxylating dioxygenase [Acidimicrobiales bacterium]
MLKERKPLTGLPDIDPDEVERRLADGWTLPATLYTDPVVARLEDQLIFRPSWQVIGTLADFRNPGDFLTAKVGRYPVLVARGRDGELRAFMNVCRHRGALVSAGEKGDEPDNVSGNCSRFRCHYHGWTYGLDGRLLGAPNYTEGALPPFDELGLIPVSVDTWGGAVFVSIEPDEPLATALSDVPNIADEKGYKDPFLDEEVVFAGAFEWNVKANWKAFQEVNMECYHCGVTHANSLASVMNVGFDDVCIVNYKNMSHLSGPFVEDLDERIGTVAAGRLKQRVADTNEPPFSQFWLWPNTVLSHGVGWGFGIYRIDPVGAGRCRMTARIYGKPSDEADTGRVLEMLPNVIDEDVAIIESAQMGMDSGAREWGPMLSTGLEESIHRFSTQVWGALAPGFRAAQA